MQKVYFFIGTKAQAIKCISLINLLSEKSNLSIVIVDSGQHTKITEDIFKSIKNEITYLNLFSNRENISSYLNGFLWAGKFFLKNIIFKTLKNENNMNKKICVVHGDTVSTLLGLIWAKRNNCKVLHLESGLTSNSYINPFPEEIIRKITTRFSDILVCFDSDAYDRLVAKYKKKYILQVSENTVIETLGDIEDKNFVKKELVTATLHRTENIFSKNRLLSFITLLNNLSSKFEVNWYLHEPTINALKKFNIKTSDKINKLNLLEHNEFIDQIKQSKAVITDGGSIQEECYYLGVTTVIWRNATERPYSLNENMLISKFDINKSYDFVLNNKNKNISFNNKNYSPSEEIYNYLIKNRFINQK